MISTRATRRPELDKAINLGRELWASGVSVTLVVHEQKRVGRGLELAALGQHQAIRDVLPRTSCRAEPQPERLRFAMTTSMRRSQR